VFEYAKSDGTLWVLYPCMLNKLSNIYPVYPAHIPSFEDSELNPYTPQSIKSEQISRVSPIAVIGPRNTPRMQAQLGVFSIIHRDTTPIEELDTGKHCIRYRIPANAKKTLKQELSLLGVGRLQLFPELESIGHLLRGELK